MEFPPGSCWCCKMRESRAKPLFQSFGERKTMTADRAERPCLCSDPRKTVSGETPLSALRREENGDSIGRCTSFQPAAAKSRPRESIGATRARNHPSSTAVLISGPILFCRCAKHVLRPQHFANLPQAFVPPERDSSVFNNNFNKQPNPLS